MGLQVIGAGFGRTGTLSLKAALERLLGSPCHHMFELFAHPEQAPTWSAAARGEPVDWAALLEGYAAQVDWPGCAFWRELADAFPDALVVLSVRDLDRWWDSANATVLRVLTELQIPDDLATMRPVQDMARAVVVGRSLGGADPTDREAVIAAHERHLAEVQAGVPAERLLVFEVSEGWEPLCARLGLPVPDEPFPNLNDRAMFESLFGLTDPA